MSSATKRDSSASNARRWTVRVPYVPGVQTGKRDFPTERMSISSTAVGSAVGVACLNAARSAPMAPSSVAKRRRPIAGFLLGWSTHNDIAYDGTAFWGHVATGVSGRADRLGRLVPTAMAGSVLLPGYAALACALTGRWSLWPVLLGIGLGFLLTGFGVASVMSALKPFPVPGPGENPFGAPPGSSALTVVLQAVAGAAVFVLNLPLLALGIGALLGNVWMGWLCLALAVVLGSAALALGTWWGARIYDRRAPELLADLARIG